MGYFLGVVHQQPRNQSLYMGVPITSTYKCVCYMHIHEHKYVTSCFDCRPVDQTGRHYGRSYPIQQSLTRSSPAQHSPFKDPGHSGLRGPSSWIPVRGVSPSGVRDPLIIPSDRVPKSLFIDPIIPTHQRAPDPLLFCRVFLFFMTLSGSL